MISNIWRKSCCKRRQSKLGMSTISQDLSRKSRTAQIQIFEILPPSPAAVPQPMIADQSPLCDAQKMIQIKVWLRMICPLLGSLTQSKQQFLLAAFFQQPRKCFKILWISTKNNCPLPDVDFCSGPSNPFELGRFAADSLELLRRTIRADGLWQLGNCSYHIPYWSILNKSGSRIKALNLQNV